MRHDGGGLPNMRRIRAMARALHRTYRRHQGQGAWDEQLAALALFVDTVLHDLEQVALHLDDYSVLPGEVRDLFSLLLNQSDDWL